MIRRRLLVIGCLAAAIGGVASMYVYRSLEAKLAATNPTKSNVVVAAQDIQLGARINAGDLQVVDYEARYLPKEVLRRAEVAVGHVALLPMAKGEFVLPYKIGTDGTGNRLTEQIPVGMRAVQVPVAEFESGSIKVGDRVDVFATGKAPGSNDTQTRAVLMNIGLLAVEPRAVTLVVAPEDAERLTLATHESRVKLILRNPTDTSQEKIPEITRANLYGETQPKKRRVKRVSGVPSNALPDLEIQVIHGTQPPETIKVKQ